jgi:transcription antitermination factor NusG
MPKQLYNASGEPGNGAHIAVARPPAGEQSQGRSWFALRVKPNHEKSAVLALQAKDFQGFVPLYKSKRSWSDRVKILELPFFPGYVFCRFEWHARLPVITTPGIRYVVGSARIPITIPDAEIAAIQAVERSGLPVRPCPFLAVGQRVRISGGPLWGLEGLLKTIKNDHRLVVSVNLLQRSVAVEVSSAWIAPFLIPTSHSVDPAHPAAL